MSDDYYELLEVERTADDGTIKSSYRKLAMRFHPDKNPGCADSEAKFKAISEAYDVLKDPQKRAAYDQYGKAAFQNGGGGGPQDFSGFSDIFDNIFGEFMGGGRNRQRGPQRGPDLRFDLEITLERIMLQAIISHDHFKIRIGLIGKTPQHFLKPFWGIIGCKNNAYFHFSS